MTVLNNDGTFDYELLTPFEYAKKGDVIQATFINCKPPCAKNIQECAALKQAVFRSLPQRAENEPVPEKKEGEAEEMLTADEIIVLLSASEKVELSTVLITAGLLFTKGERCLVDGEEKLTKPLFDLMSMDDIERMTGEYLVNFVLASSLGTKKGR